MTKMTADELVTKINESDGTFGKEDIEALLDDVVQLTNMNDVTNVLNAANSKPWRQLLIDQASLRDDLVMRLADHTALTAADVSSE